MDVKLKSSVVTHFTQCLARSADSLGLAGSSYARLCPQKNQAQGSTSVPLEVVSGSGVSSLEPRGAQEGMWVMPGCWMSEGGP